MKQFEVIMPDIADLKPYYRNAKVHSKQQIADIARSIRDFGFDQPVVVDSDMVIIKGHGRYFAAMRLQMKTIPVVVRDDLNEAQAMAARIADNKIFEMTTVDPEKHESELNAIAEELSGVDTDSLDFNTPSVPAPEVDETYEPSPDDMEEPEYDESEEPPESVLGDGELVCCPKCIHSFYISEE